MKPISFEDWVAEREEKEIGTKSIISNRLFRLNDESREVMARQMGNAFARKLVGEGLRLSSGDLFLEDDALRPVKKITSVLTVSNGELPTEYVSFVFTHWREDYEGRLTLQNASLFNLLKWWGKRCWLKWRRHYIPGATDTQS